MLFSTSPVLCDNQIVVHNPHLNSFISQFTSFMWQSRIEYKCRVFLCFDTLSFSKTYQCITVRQRTGRYPFLTILVHFFRISLLKFIFFHAALFSCCTFCVVIFSSCILSSCFTLFRYCSISCFTFTRCNVLVLHSAPVALFACCNFFLQHFVHVVLHYCFNKNL